MASALVETIYHPGGAGTLMTIRMTLPDAETRATILAIGMKRATPGLKRCFRNAPAQQLWCRGHIIESELRGEA